jgi:hypothetical protein
MDLVLETAMTFLLRMSELTLLTARFDGNWQESIAGLEMAKGRLCSLFVRIAPVMEYYIMSKCS